MIDNGKMIIGKGFIFIVELKLYYFGDYIEKLDICRVCVLMNSYGNKYDSVKNFK